MNYTDFYEATIELVTNGNKTKLTGKLDLSAIELTERKKCKGLSEEDTAIKVKKTIAQKKQFFIKKLYKEFLIKHNAQA